MNKYQLLKEVQNLLYKWEELQEIAEVQQMNGDWRWQREEREAKKMLKELEPLKKLIEKEKPLEKVDEHHYNLSLDRICIFRTKKGNVKYALYSEEANASDKRVQNDHYALHSIIEDKAWGKEDLNSSERWCGFYKVLCGNSEKITMILYGESSTYPITITNYKLLEDFAKQIKKDNEFGKIERFVVQSLKNKEIFLTNPWEQDDLPF